MPTSHQGIGRSPRLLAFDFEFIFCLGIGFIDARCFGQLFREALFEPLQFTGIRGVVLMQDALEFMVDGVELIKPLGIRFCSLRRALYLMHEVVEFDAHTRQTFQ